MSLLEAQIIYHPDKTDLQLSEVHLQELQAFLGENQAKTNGKSPMRAYVELPEKWRPYVRTNPGGSGFQLVRFFYIDLAERISPKVGTTYVDQIGKFIYCYHILNASTVEVIDLEVYLIPFDDLEVAQNELKKLEDSAPIPTKEFEKKYPEAIYTETLHLAKVELKDYEFIQLIEGVEEGNYVIYNRMEKNPPYLYAFKLKSRKQVKGIQASILYLIDPDLETEVKCSYCGGMNEKTVDACEYCGAPKEAAFKQKKSNSKCSTCGGQNDSDASVCKYCGASLKD